MGHNLPTESKGEKGDGQHWDIVRELWMRKDKELCENWKDEVQNVLIFAGLFSAIVTAFLIESHKNLLPESTQQRLQISGKDGADRRISICVNVFWFLSLVFSLTAALVGIVSLQWIRSHMRGLSSGAESLGLSYMHSLGLHQSYIPLVFTSLPVILIFGLTFFLIGLVVFLFEISWPVAIPVTIAIACTFAFLVITTAHPGLQLLPASCPSDKPNCYPSPYRSPQSLLFFQLVTLIKRWWLGLANPADHQHSTPRADSAPPKANLAASGSGSSVGGVQPPNNSHLKGDWTSRSRIWFHQRKEDFSAIEEQLSHLESKWEDVRVEPFAYDVIQALISVKESRSAQSEREKTALAKCLAEVLPIHLKLFPTGDLADLIPFLPPSTFVPATLFSQNSATVEDLSAVALLQVATSNGRPRQTAALAQACIRTTRWLFKQPRTLDSVPERQPLHLISNLGLYELSPDLIEDLISTLTHFFAFAANYRPDNQSINKTTHTSSYTYWFLVLSAQILSRCLLSEEMQNRHAYVLDVIAIHLGDGEERDYLFLTATIYASIISASRVARSSEDGRHLLGVVGRYHASKEGLNRQQLREALKVDEVPVGNAHEPADAGSVPDSNISSGSGTVYSNRSEKRFEVIVPPRSP